MKWHSLLQKARKQAAFTMIELLIVISILGILAVAVLAAINPVEQINRGRDTGTRSDAEQLLSAIDRFYAYKGYYPWVVNPNDDSHLDWSSIETVDGWVDNSTTPCSVLDKLSNGTDACEGTNELKRSFVDKITATGYNHLQVFFTGESGDSLYVCFLPVSGAFKEEAMKRCEAGLPDDLSDSVCDDTNSDYYICLP
jgi:prepilin-type N-terminal cleavage/methylation domain-containing protein